MKHKKEYQGGKCKHCGSDDLFHEISSWQTVLLYCTKNHCCTACAADILTKRSKEVQDGNKGS